MFLFIYQAPVQTVPTSQLKKLPYVFASHFAPAQLFEALNIYRNNFKPSEFLQAPYTIACINVIAADSDQEAEKISTSMIRMMFGVLTGNIDYLQEPVNMTSELRDLSENPTFQRMLKYSFVGSKETLKQKTADFLQKTGVNELMVASHIFHHQDRVKSYRIFSQVMKEF